MELTLRPPATGAGAPTLPGRECNGCNVCCVALTIDDPALQKPQGVRCPNNRADNLCAIYEARPDTCREFQCGWKVLKWVAPSLRPDRSGVLLRPHRNEAGVQTGVVAIVMRRGALNVAGLAETLAAAVAAGVPIHLGVPGPPGHPSARTQLNAELAPAVAAHDKVAFTRELRRIYLALAAVKPGRAGSG